MCPGLCRVHMYIGILAAEATRLTEILEELGAAGHPYKLTIPAPALLGERMWQAAQSSAAYASYEEFVHDTVPLLAREIEHAVALPHPPAVIQVHVRNIHDVGT